MGLWLQIREFTIRKPLSAVYSPCQTFWRARKRWILRSMWTLSTVRMGRIMGWCLGKLRFGHKGLKQSTDLVHRDMDNDFGLVYDVVPGVGRKSLALILLHVSGVGC